MSKLVHIDKARSARQKNTAPDHRSDGFTPCSPDMTICGDCADNRAKQKCPRLREWLARRTR